MKISINWLKDYIELKETPQKIADLLTMGIAEVEGIEYLGSGLDNVVVGEIKKIEKHPQADKLFVAKVNIGRKLLQIVFGGVVKLNIGDKLSVAVAPAKLASGIEIKKMKIRGIDSEGMFCLNEELDILDKDKKVFFFDKKIKNGTKISQVLGLEDTVLEIDNKSLTHRPDLFSHIGIARELSAFTKRKLRLPKVQALSGKNIEKKLVVKVQNKKLCPYYTACVLDVEIGESPQWIKNRLYAVGLRPINNVVDVTNYVMLEYGQPLHAFDYRSVFGKEIIVRIAKKAEKIITLDKVKRILDKSMLVIADAKKPIALAGIMGGLSSEVSSKTKTIVLEAAVFDPVCVRKTSQKLGLRTEALTRFEKGLSCDFPEKGLLRAINLLQKTAKAKVVSKIFDKLTEKPRPKVITLDNSYLNKLLGKEISINETIRILQSLEFKAKRIKDKLKVATPLFRTDVNQPEDLIEEVARVYGYGNIKPQKIFGELKPASEIEDLYWQRRINQILTGIGFSEVYNYSFYGKQLLAQCRQSFKEHIELANSLSDELQYLRVSLLPRLFKNAELNVKQFEKFKIFEIGHIYTREKEEKMLSGLILDNQEKVFYEAKGVVEFLFKELNIEFKSRPESMNKDFKFKSIYDKDKTIYFFSQNKSLGLLSLANVGVLENFGLKDKKIAFFEFSLNRLAKLASNKKVYKPFPKFPPVVLDLAFILNKNISAEEITKVILKQGSPLLKEVELFDVYSGKPLKENQKNLAFHLVYQAEDRTLKNDEVFGVQRKIVSFLENKFKAKLRGKYF